MKVNRCSSIPYIISPPHYEKLFYWKWTENFQKLTSKFFLFFTFYSKITYVLFFPDSNWPRRDSVIDYIYNLCKCLLLFFANRIKEEKGEERGGKEKYIIRSVAGKKVDTSETLDERSL